MADFTSEFNVIKKLGEGARCQVYQVVRPATGEVFALKRVTRERHEDNRFLDQAINEHEISKGFSHPFLRKSMELRRIRSFLRLIEVQVVMELVDGTSLGKCRPERINKTIMLFIKVAQGLAYMHQKGYVHADIKPNNILLTYDGAVKIIDFGQCCKIGFIKPRIQGTPDYIAPEQVERQSLSRKTDVYNLGATLYWSLTGQTYPTAITRQGGRQEVRRPTSVPSPRDLNPQIPPLLSRLVMACCEHDRFQRPKDMNEVIRRLEMALQLLSESAPVESPRRTTKSSTSQKKKSSKRGPGPAADTRDREGADETCDYSAFKELDEPHPDSDLPRGENS